MSDVTDLLRDGIQPKEDLGTSGAASGMVAADVALVGACPICQGDVHVSWSALAWVQTRGPRGGWYDKPQPLSSTMARPKITHECDDTAIRRLAEERAVAIGIENVHRVTFLRWGSGAGWGVQS